MDNDRGGFTFIELMIVVAVIVLFGGLALANYGQFNEEKKLDEEVKKLSATLHLARSRAVASDVDPATCSDFRGYRIKISVPTSYNLERDCGGTYTSLQAQTLPKSVTISTSIAEAAITFKPLSAETDLTSQGKITIKNSILSPAKCADITVEQSGAIKEGIKYTTNC